MQYNGVSLLAAT